MSVARRIDETHWELILDTGEVELFTVPDARDYTSDELESMLLDVRYPTA